MFDFDDYGDLSEYEFTYPAEAVLAAKYKKQENNIASYEDFVVDYVKHEIIKGCRKYGEFESEWGVLKSYSKDMSADALDKVYILYDQVLLLLFEGNTLPPNIIY